MEPVRVDVTWFSEASGGRTSPPDGPNYATTVRFEDESLDEVVSAMLQRVGTAATNGNRHWIADLRLLFPDKLSDKIARLQPGRTLVIHEGRRVVGQCEILAQTAAEVGA